LNFLHEQGIGRRRFGQLLEEPFGRQAVAAGGLVIARQAVQQCPFIAGLGLLGMGLHNTITALDGPLQALDFHLPQAVAQAGQGGGGIARAADAARQQRQGQGGG